jgi:hypothetical protein
MLFSGGLTINHWLDQPPSMSPNVRAASLHFAAYLQAHHLADREPIVLLFPPLAPNVIGLQFNSLLATLPPSRIPHVYVYVGSPTMYLSDAPTTYRSDNWTTSSRYFYPYVAQVAKTRPPTFVIRDLNPYYYTAWVKLHPSSIRSDGIAQVAGSRLPPAGHVPRPARDAYLPNTITQYASLAAVMLILMLCGLGWSGFFLPQTGDPLSTALAAPAIGLAVIAVTGTLLSTAGIGLTGTPGIAIVAAIAISGWVLRLVGTREPAHHAGGE